MGVNCAQQQYLPPAERSCHICQPATSTAAQDASRPLDQRLQGGWSRHPTPPTAARLLVVQQNGAPPLHCRLLLLLLPQGPPLQIECCTPQRHGSKHRQAVSGLAALRWPVVVSASLRPKHKVSIVAQAMHLASPTAEHSAVLLPTPLGSLLKDAGLCSKQPLHDASSSSRMAYLSQP